jgi:anaerobic selenocysteine-containing dehydrogenase
MDDLSRREFIKRSSAGVAVGALAIGSGATIANAVAANAAEMSTSGTNAASAETSEPIVAYVRKGAHGEVRLMVGEQEVVHRDADLARRIIRAADR